MSLGGDLVIQEAEHHPRMVDRDHYLKEGMVDREIIPNLGITIQEVIEIGQNLQFEDRIKIIKVDHELRQEVSLFLR